MLISVALIFFLLLGVASAADVDSVSIKEDSNFDDSVNTLSSQNNLEISNEVSISETNIVNSQNDNLENSYSNAVLSSGISDENNNGNLQASYSEANNTSNSDTLKSSGNVLGDAKKVPVKMSVTSAVSNNSATLFKVSVKDSETNKAVNGAYKVLIFLDGTKYVGTTNNGVAQIVTKALSAGTYNINLTFTGSASRYLVTDATQKVTVSSTSKKVPVKMSVTSAVSNNSATLFKVSVLDSETNKAVNGAYKVLIILDGTKYIGTTNNGVAQITTKALNAGTYNINLTFTGSASRYLVTDATQKVTVTKSSTIKKVPVKMSVTSAISNGEATMFKVSVLDSETNKAVNGAYKVLLILDGTKYVGTTDNGVAGITTKYLNEGTYNVDLTFTGSASRYLVTDASQKVTVTKKVPVKMNITGVTSNSTAAVFNVSVLDGETNKAVNGAYKVLLILDGKKYVGTTNNGVAQITTKSLESGTYNINLTFTGSASRYAVTDATQKVTVTKKVPVKMSVTSAISNSASTVFTVSVLDSETNKAVNGAYKVLLILDGKKYVGTTSNGVAEITTKSLSAGTYNINLTFTGSISRYLVTDATQKVTVSKSSATVTLNNLITASKNLKSYVEKNKALPSTVTIGGVTYTTAQYLYLASEAILKLKSGDKSAVTVKLVNAPKSPTTASDLGNLNDYYTVAKRVVDYGNTNGNMPGSVASDVGNIGYDGLVYASARIVAFYGTESEMPNYVTIKSLSSASSVDSINSKNTITNLEAYLAASTNCQVNNAQIKALAAKLTSGLTSELAKAKAIYNYVRDSISYSFYYDTKHGAVGTLNAKSGNCVDQAHLLIALYRASDLPARYVHGTCKFSSGSTYGHVWTQVLINGVWTVGDPTSTRNSLGSVANWNTNSYTLNGYYSSISF